MPRGVPLHRAEMAKQMFAEVAAGASVREVCARHGVHRGLFYHWKRLHQEGGFERLAEDRRGGPRLDARRREAAISLALRHPGWSGTVIAEYLTAQGDETRPDVVRTWLRQAGFRLEWRKVEDRSA